MQCQVCEKTFAAELSVCPSCGTMPTQHTQAESSLRLLSIEKITTSDLELEIGEPPMKKPITAPLENKNQSLESRLETFRTQRSETRTLLEFPPKRQKSPEWRDEIKNLVKRRKDGAADETAHEDEKESKPKKTAEPALVINLKPNIAEQKKRNILADALERIERSRQQFGKSDLDEYEIEDEEMPIKMVVETGKRGEAGSNSPLSLVPPREALPIFDGEAAHQLETRISTERKSVFNVPLNLPAAPNDVFVRAGKNSEKIAAEDVSSDLEDEETVNAALGSVRKVDVKPSPLDNQQPAARVSTARQRSSTIERIEDYAPLGQRVAAGLIDFAASILISVGLLIAFGTIEAASFGLSSILLISAVATGVLFVYSTVSLLLSGTTLGLRFFQMRVVAVENGDALSLSQVVVNNAVYILSLWFAGIGLLTALFSTEKRALHDIAAGTVVVQD